MTANKITVVMQRIEKIFFSTDKPSSLTSVNATIENAQIRQVAIMLRKIQPIADDKFIGNLKATVINRHVDFAAARLIKERANFYAVCLFVEEVINKVIHRRSGIDNVLNEQKVASFGVVVEVFENVDLAGGV